MKFFKYTILLLIIIASLTLSAQNTDETLSPDSVAFTTEELADSLVNYAHHFLGTRYSYGASGPNSFDCSGFTSYIYRQFGFNIGRSSREQAKNGTVVEGDISNLQKGDLILFGARRDSKSIGHVGIYIGPSPNNQQSFQFIHAARTGITISEYSEPYYTYRFLGARRILPTYFKTPDWNVDPLDNITVIPDTLVLSPEDMRLVLLADSTWALIDSLGHLSRPETSDKIVLYGNGSWEYIHPSQVMVPPHSTPRSTSTTAVTSTERPQDAQYYQVKSGDTLYGIARRNNTTVKTLCSLNGISETTVLQIGRKIRIR